jgi:hypothetical protein
MRLAGIDGVIIDWYGLQDFRDYATLHRNTARLVEQLVALGMRFTICYEDQTIPALVAAGRLPADQRVAQAARDLDWLAEHWFALPAYVQLDERPVLLSFGQTGLTDEEWGQCLQQIRRPLAYFSLHRRRPAAVGAFDWPLPAEGRPAVERFRQSATAWPHAIPVAFPRFVDIYEQARVHASYGRVADDGGAAFREQLEQALASRPPIVQIATWNDWGEGTVIEPSIEFGYRDLESVQQMRRRLLDPAGVCTPEDLRLPWKLLELRRQARDPAGIARCDRIRRDLAEGRLEAARAELANGSAAARERN